MKLTPRSFAALMALCLGAALLVGTPPSSAAPGHGHGHDKKCDKVTSVNKLLQCVTLEGVMEHQWALQKIANAHDGNRASGTSGYDASADYVAKRMRKAGYKVSTQTFQYFSFEEMGPSALVQTAPGSVTYVEDTDFAATPHSEEGDVTAAVTAVDVQLGVGNTSTSGCEPEDFDGFPAGNIALIQRGTCTFEIKGNNAAAAGAAGILFFNQGNTTAPDRNNIPAVTLGNGYTGGIPALNATYALGAELAGTSGLEMRLFANVSREDGETSNVIAESKWGDPRNVVMAGAHLDSVPEGPGINDNGSGSSGLLETAEQMSKVKTANKVRFAWWGGEEGSLVGSTFYVGQLTPEQLADLEMYLNFDMIGSPNYGLFRYDGDGSDFEPRGSGRVRRDRGPVREVLHRAWLRVRGKSVQRALRLRGVHRQRCPGRRAVHRGGGHQDRGAGRQVGRGGGHRLRPVLPRGVRHDPQREPGRAADQLRRHRLRHVPVRHRRRGDQRLGHAGRSRAAVALSPPPRGCLRAARGGASEARGD